MIHSVKVSKKEKYKFRMSHLPVEQFFSVLIFHSRLLQKGKRANMNFVTFSEYMQRITYLKFTSLRYHILKDQ